MLTLVLAVMASVAALADGFTSAVFVILIAATALVAALAIEASKRGGAPGWHRLLEGRALPFTVLTGFMVLVGGIAEIVPTVIIGANDAATTSQQPYSALELEGRDVYVSEGCYTCHSQMIRPFMWETARYGAPSESNDSVWDHPFQWGSKRTGPDLAREGGRYPDAWHARHMEDPRSTSPGSIMPAYKLPRKDLENLTSYLMALPE
jgi:cytochrome c oxidase cbb3-type subunit I/II